MKLIQAPRPSASLAQTSQDMRKLDSSAEPLSRYIISYKDVELRAGLSLDPRYGSHEVMTSKIVCSARWAYRILLY